MTRLSPFLSRLLAVALVLALGVAVKYLAVDPVLQTRGALVERIERSERLLDAYRQRRANLVALLATSEQGNDPQRDSTVFLSGSNPTLVGAQLQSRAQALIEQAGGRLVSAQILDAETDSGLRRVTLRTRMSSSIAGLQRVLHAFESETPYLFVDNVSIRPARRASRRSLSRRRVRRGSVPTSDPGDLTVAFDLYGFIRKGGDA